MSDGYVPKGRFAAAVAAASIAALVGAAGALGGEIFRDLDARTGTIAPTGMQQATVAGLDAHATWSSFGTPATLIKYGDYLATGVAGGNPVDVARSWLASQAGLFRLTPDRVRQLELVSEGRMAEGSGNAVTFRQRFSGLPAGIDGLVTVGVRGSNVAFASSSLSGESSTAGTVRLGPREAWRKAAADVGRQLSAADLGKAKTDRDWQVFRAKGLAQPQRARLVAVPTQSGVRPAYETLVVDVKGGAATGFQHFVDAETGAVIVRKDLVEQSHPVADAFSGAVTGPDGSCDADKGPWVVASGESVESIAVGVEAALTTNDSVIHLLRNGVIVASQDTVFSPEALVYDPTDNGQGTYRVRVCDFGDGEAWTAPKDYVGQIAFSNIGTGTAFPYPPEWKVFRSYPLLGLDAYPWNFPSTDTREIWCWQSSVGSPPVPLPECQREVANTASRVPWDFSAVTNTPTFTTVGNNARSAEAWTSPLTPGATSFRPVSLDRKYVYPWTNAWFTSKCFTPFVPGESHDISAAVTNLFAMHNRMHDWSYHLGFTERNWNAQESNFGTGGTLQNDPVTGNAQAGALDGGFPSYLGRDNANMVSLPDGVPPITNMYLWQPLAGGFYAPCVDGDYDMAVIGHEYTHLIENRMIGKGGTRGGHHAGAMGESHSDLNAVEYLNEYGFVPVSGENRFAVGAYATGNKRRAIRNYGMNFARTGDFPSPGRSPEVNPLNFSNMGYDLTGPQVHADGEIWSAVNFDIRDALIGKFNGSFSASNQALQRECADGQRPANLCPGNRRWIQLMYDAFLLMPTAPSMLQARDAYLAADVMRFGGANQMLLWHEFAQRGFGQFAQSTNSAADTDSDPLPDFESPLETEGTVTFVARDAANGNAVKARIYVGHYQGRTSPIADTDGTTGGARNLDQTAKFVPGLYELVANAKGFGHMRFRLSATAGPKTVTLTFARNLASMTSGATASGDGVDHANLIDDTESTSWQRVGAQPNVAGSQVTVDLGGGAQVVRLVNVSAMLQPGQNRFTALRGFDIWTCSVTLANANCTAPGAFTKLYSSPGDAFPGRPPRPVSPELILRTFDVPDTTATHVRIVVRTNQCMGNSAFQGEQDNDPLNGTDCREGSPGSGTVEIFGDLPQVLAPRDNEVRIAELQVFSGAASANTA